MNKAFIREPEDTGQRYCPRCGSLAQLVREATLAAQLSPENKAFLAEPAWFCPYPACDVAYFDAFERTVGVEALRSTMYPKDSTGPLCSCFGLTCDDVDDDIREGGVTRVRELIAKAKSPLARCTEAAPNGQSCVAEVQRYYMKRMAAKNS